MLIVGAILNSLKLLPAGYTLLLLTKTDSFLTFPVASRAKSNFDDPENTQGELSVPGSGA